MITYRAELLRSLSRATYWFLGMCLGLIVFGMVNAKPQHHLPLNGFRQAAIIVATLIMGRAATLAAGDFSSGTIRPWLISSPRRGSVCLGKLAASVTVAVVFSIAAGLVGFAASAALGTVPSLSEVASLAGQLLLACVAFTIFGHGIGVLIRNIPVALCVTLGWVLAGEHLLASDNGSRWLPGLVAQKITLGKFTGGEYAGALAHVFIPFLLVEALALVLFLRRDVNN
jgi:ABC-type transport system involved in multi-copper enzyme maturation permease subunit